MNGHDQAGLDATTDESAQWAWEEYDFAAEDLARRGLAGTLGDPLPINMNTRAVCLINDDPEAFQDRVRQHAYALAMNKLNLPEL